MKVDTQRALAGQWAAALTAVALALALAASCIPAAAWGSPATEAANNAVEQAETEVSRTAAAYESALSEQERLAAEIASLNSKIGELEGELPAQETRSNESCVALYKMAGIDSSFIAVLLSARTPSEAIALIDNYNFVINHNVAQLVRILQRLRRGGNSVVVIEHNLDVIKTADYIIDMGPEGGDEGGRVIACGTPDQVARVSGSATAEYLAPILAKAKAKTKKDGGKKTKGE